MDAKDLAAQWASKLKGPTPAMAPSPAVASPPPASPLAPDAPPPVDYAALTPDATYVQTMDGRPSAQVAPAMAWCDAMEAMSPADPASVAGLAQYANDLASGH